MRTRYFPLEDNPAIKARASWLFRIVAAVMFLYLMRVYSLQVYQEDYYKELADKNRIRIVHVPAPRGLIYDRHGNLLVKNVPEFNLYAVAGDMPNPEAVLKRLDLWMALDPSERLLRDMMAARSRFSPVKIKGRLALEEIARIEGNMWDVPGIKVTAELRRNAVYGSLAAHILGYISEVSKAQIASGRVAEDIRPGHNMGQFGVEYVYDPIIRGRPGEKWMEVDVFGQELQLLRMKKPIEGNDLFLTLDLELQKVAEEALGEAAGSVVAMDPNNGEILAMASHPAFNPDLLSGGGSRSRLAALLNDPSRPMMNRSIQGQYSPGSTFKILVSLAALETEEVKSSERVLCQGSFAFGNRRFRDWKKQGHGSVDLHRALVESCDVYFYQMGNRIGVDAIAKFSNLFGLGMPTGIPLANEKPGLIPSTAWKAKVLKEPWYPGETLSVAIGQGYVLVTPLQMAMMISAVANNGTLYKPALLRQRRDPQTHKLSAVVPENGVRIPVLKETLDILKKALVDVVATPHGTAAGSRSKLVSFAGKTGTAQVVALKKEGKRGNLPKHLDDHAWFVSYAPVENPKIAVVVLVEHGGHGASAAAPIAKKMIEAYLAPTSSSPKSPNDSTPMAAPL